MFDWLVAVAPWRVVLRYVTVGCGEQCVVICGEEQMQLWYAGNLDTPVQVRSTIVAITVVSILIDK